MHIYIRRPSLQKVEFSQAYTIILANIYIHLSLIGYIVNSVKPHTFVINIAKWIKSVTFYEHVFVFVLGEGGVDRWQCYLEPHPKACGPHTALQHRTNNMLMNISSAHSWFRPLFLLYTMTWVKRVHGCTQATLTTQTCSSKESRFHRKVYCNVYGTLSTD